MSLFISALVIACCQRVVLMFWIQNACFLTASAGSGSLSTWWGLFMGNPGAGGGSGRDCCHGDLSHLHPQTGIVNSGHTCGPRSSLRQPAGDRHYAEWCLLSLWAPQRANLIVGKHWRKKMSFLYLIGSHHGGEEGFRPLGTTGQGRETFLVAWLGEGCQRHLVGRGRDVAEHPTMHRTPFPQQ